MAVAVSLDSVVKGALSEWAKMHKFGKWKGARVGYKIEGPDVSLEGDGWVTWTLSPRRVPSWVPKCYPVKSVKVILLFLRDGQQPRPKEFLVVGTTYLIRREGRVTVAPTAEALIDELARSKPQPMEYYLPRAVYEP